MMYAPIVERVVLRFSAETKGPPEADAPLHEPLSEEALKHLEAAGRKHNIIISPEGTHKLLVKAPEGWKEKQLLQAFEKAWSGAGFTFGQAEMDAWGKFVTENPGANYKEWNAKQPRSGLGALTKPKLDFSRYTHREVGTGRYMHTKWTRLCKCGHPVGVHAAEKHAGSQPCFASDLGIPCDCQLFRPTTNFLTDEEYKKTYGKIGSRFSLSTAAVGGMDRLAQAVVTRFLHRLAEAEVGYGSKGKSLSYQGDFPETTPCGKCGKEARLALAVREDGVTKVHPNDPKGEGFWLHDAGAFATYLCTDIKCAGATTLWNQA